MGSQPPVGIHFFLSPPPHRMFILAMCGRGFTGFPLYRPLFKTDKPELILEFLKAAALECLTVFD